MLDPRPESLARATPYANAANIPLESLAARSHELPPPGETVLIAAGENSEEAAALLRTLGRPSEIVDSTLVDVYRQTPLWTLNPTLARIVEGMAPGRVLDLGCGSGRDAVWLAARGWTVIGVDHLPDALDRARDLSRHYSPENPVQTVGVDLYKTVPEGCFDLVWMAYGLFERAFRECNATVKAVETFAPCHREHYNKPSRILSLEMCRSWNLGDEILAEEGWRGDRCTVRYAARSAGVSPAPR
ncbi:methyltransferase domain-containing protein [bacterium]|nr:MAG: methyltransferase domain-containing protein [bacterium]